MKIWCTLSRNSANKWSESCALWSSFPFADVFKIFLGKLLYCLPDFSRCFLVDLLNDRGKPCWVSGGYCAGEWLP